MRTPADTFIVSWMLKISVVIKLVYAKDIVRPVCVY